MKKIIAGHIQQQSYAEDITQQLVNHGFSRQEISYFYLSPPGRGNKTPVGGQELVDKSSQDTPQGTAAGVAIGAIVGTATTPLLGPVGIGVGGHIGGLIGAMASTDDTISEAYRKDGMMIAVAVNDDKEEWLIEFLKKNGVEDIEKTQGNIQNGDWKDFNINQAPHYVEP